MMPVFRDSCPHQRNQVPFAQYCYPSYDGISPQMMVDQSRPPIMYESQPHGYNYGYSIPRHGCCDHGNFPGFYGFRPDFFHFSPTPPSYCCGLHPPLPEPYPLQYAHPPHHAMKQWKYEYDKDARRDFHCCGCPNHISNSKNDKGVIIEEQEPDVVKKSDLLVPVQSRNYLHPTVWIPPEYAITSDEHRRPFESVVAEQEKVPRNKMSHENVKCSEGEPRLWNGQFPLDMNSLKSLMQGEDEKGKQNQQIEEGIRPHPIIWKPSNNEQREPERKDQRNVSIWFPLDMNSLKSLMEVEDEKRKQNQHNEDGMRKFSHPIIWMPPKNEQREPEKDQRNMNSWFPVDLNSLKSLMQGEDEKRMEKQQNEDKMRQYPYPIIWMPFKSELGEAEKKDRREMNAAPTSAEEPSSGFKFAQVKPSECVGVKKSETSKENHCGQVTRSQMTESTGNHKIIPVKQMEVHTEEDNSEGAKQKVAADNSSGTNKKRHSSSLPKASKLPPVSLRLEPFPGKKNCNDNSRSPSPPGLKRQSQGDTPKPSASSSSIEKTPEGMQSPYASLKMSEENPKKSEQKGIDMVDIDAWENKNEHVRNGAEMENSAKLSIGSQEVVTGKSSTETSGKDSNRCGLREDKGVVCERDMTVKGATKELVKLNDPAESVGGERKAKKKNFSDIQAAVLIQSAYRGFEVRKLEPLKKLKQMAEVRQQVAEVRNRIQALESSTDLQKYDKEEVVIGEMIMRLLLKLDTIQGLHPSLRDIRKALAKDLVTLQEELDSLTMKSKGLSEEVTAAKVVIDPSIETRDDLGMQEMQNNDVGNLENSPGTSHDNCVNKKEQDQSKLLNMVDLSSNYQGQEPSEPARGDKEVNERCEQEMKKELPERNCVESQVGESSADRVRDKTANGKVDVSQAVMTEIQEGYDMHPQPQQCARLPLISEEKTSSQKLTGAQLRESCCAPSGENEAAVGRVNGAINVEDNPEAESTELPLKMIDEEPSGCELKNDEPAGKGKTEIVDAEIKSNMLAGPTLPAEVDNINEVEKAIASNVDPEATLVAELPIGVLEEDLAGPTLPAEVDNIDEVEKAIASNVNPEANLVAELPIGVPEEDSFVDNKQIETGKAGPTLPTEVDNMNEVEKEIVTNITQETNLVPELPIGVLKEDLAVDNKQMETGEELSSMEARYKLVTNTTSPTESNDMLKVMVEELPGNAVLDMEENSPLSSIKGGERSNDEDKDSGMVDVDQMPSLESAVVSVANESEETKEDQQQKVADGIKEEDLVEKKSQCLELESVIDTDKMDEPNGSEITSHSRMSVDRKDIVMEGNKKLIEENIKLREMMEKLMEAGKEQSTVISHLTGRVKDLERKLSRKKKLRARRNKRATPAISSK